MNGVGGIGARAGILPALVVLWVLGVFGVSHAEEIDRIVAVVGSEVILLSELDEEVYLAHLREELDIEDTATVAAYRQKVLSTLVEAKLLLETARREGLHATREEVDRAVDGMIRDVRSRFPTLRTNNWILPRLTIRLRESTWSKLLS